MDEVTNEVTYFPKHYGHYRVFRTKEERVLHQVRIVPGAPPGPPSSTRNIAYLSPGWFYKENAWNKKIRAVVPWSGMCFSVVSDIVYIAWKK